MLKGPGRLAGRASGRGPSHLRPLNEALGYERIDGRFDEPDRESARRIGAARI
jgi:hypothetical protein